MQAVAVILSYLRPQNIPRIVDGLARASHVARIVVSNNNPDIDLSGLLAGRDLTLIQQSRRFGCWKRFEIASEDPAEFFICIDDDLFLSHRQVDLVLEALSGDRGSPHGIGGEVVVMSPGRIEFRSGIRGVDARLDILNRCYAFTKEHATRFFRLAALLGLTDVEQQLGPGDDILLSFAGDRAPSCHDFGPFEECPSGNDPAIAVWKRPDFHRRRAQLLLRLLALPRECTEWWAGRVVEFPVVPRSAAAP